MLKKAERDYPHLESIENRGKIFFELVQYNSGTGQKCCFNYIFLYITCKIFFIGTYTILGEVLYCHERIPAANVHTENKFCQPDFILGAWASTKFEQQATTSSRVWAERFLAMITFTDTIIIAQPHNKNKQFHLEWPKEVLLESEVWQLPFFQELYCQLPQGINWVMGDDLTSITA